MRRAGAKLILVLGHTSCGAVKAAVDPFSSEKTVSEATGCQHLGAVVGKVQKCIDPETCNAHDHLGAEQKADYISRAVDQRRLTRRGEAAGSTGQAGAAGFCFW